MKPYFLLPLFFLNILFFSPTAFSQGNIEKEYSQSIENSPVDLHSQREEEHVTVPQDDPMHDIWPHSAGDRKSDSFESKFFNMLFILGLLIAFMLLASWALKRMMKSKMTHLNTGSSIKVLETRYLSPRATLYLVEIHNQNFLIAESPTSVTYLATLPHEDHAE